MEEPIRTRHVINEQDQFSKLPEPLIIYILSLLEMQDSVKTSLLAKKWKYFWTQVHNITYKCRNRDEYYNDEFYNDISLLNHEQKYQRLCLQNKKWLSFVDHTLMKCIAPTIERFCLHGVESDEFLDKWISRAVLEKKAKIVKLTFQCRVPDCLYQGSSINDLELCCVRVSVLSPVNWSELKCLMLGNMELDDVSVENMMLGCPVLEKLILHDGYGLRSLNFMSSSAKILELSDVDTEGECIEVLKIRAPWLRELEITDKCYAKLELMDVSSLVRATLLFTPRPLLEVCEDWPLECNIEATQFHSRWIPMVSELLKSVSHVDELIVGSEQLQVLSLLKMLGRPSPVFKCKHLSVETLLWKFDLPGIICLLENTPHLETLFIKVWAGWEIRFPVVQLEELFDHVDLDWSIPNGKFLHLKNVKIDYCRASCFDDTEHPHGEFFDFELVHYILRSAAVLEKLVLYSTRWKCYGCPVPNCAFPYIPRLSSRLINTFLIRNEDAKWELKKSKNKFEFIFSNYASLHPSPTLGLA